MSRVLQDAVNQVTYPYGNGHNGIDLVKQWSQLCPIIAHSDGTVVAVRNNCSGFEGEGSYGNYVKIAHAGGYATLYAHLYSVAVSVGQEVKKGQYIGYMGSTGYAFGGHLHFEVWKNGVRIDPTPYIDADLPNADAPAKKTNEEIAREVIAGKWGVYPERKIRLEQNGYNYEAVQSIVDAMINGYTPPVRKTDEEIAKEVIEGKWSVYPERKTLLENAGYNYDVVQGIVDRMMS